MGTARGFWSYVHKDDDGMHGAIRKVAQHVQDEYGVITGDLELDLFFDGMRLKWGDKWREQIRIAIEGSTFFIPIITPRYFKSEECRNELSEFAEQAKALRQEALVMPLYFVDVPEIEAKDFDDPLIKLVADSQMKDWRTLRFLDETTQPYRRALGELAVRLHEIAMEPDASDSTEAHDSDNERGGLNEGDGTDAVTVVEALDSDSSSGSLEELVAGEEAFPRLVETLQSISADIEKVGTLAEEATAEIQESDAKGGGFKGRLLVANRLATNLKAPADELERLTSEYVADLDIVDPAMRRMIDLAAQQADDSPEDVAEFFSSIEGMVASTKEGTNGILEMVGSLDESGELSRELDVPLKRLRGSLQSLIDAHRMMDTWTSEIERVKS